MTKLSPEAPFLPPISWTPVACVSSEFSRRGTLVFDDSSDTKSRPSCTEKEINLCLEYKQAWPFTITFDPEVLFFHSTGIIL